MSKQEMKKNMNPKIVDVLITGVGVLFVSKVVVLGNIFKLNRWRKKKGYEHSQWWLLIAFSRFRFVDTTDMAQSHFWSLSLIEYLDLLRITLEYENEPSPKVFQEAMIHSCVAVVL